MWHLFNMFYIEPCTTIYGLNNVMVISTYIVTKIVCKYDIETTFFQILLGGKKPGDSGGCPRKRTVED